ncbi:plasmid replication protein, CyRepA1 family [Microcoleus sp. B4-C1]|uniref:plasmid replication protein, CyRepA1 family n=1 Tax=Microcoleus sp. B4-C1 TaxID=2818660 RepID=UPI002FD24F1F
MTSPISPLCEWLASGVDPDLFALNVQTLSDDTPYQYLLYEINAASGRVHPDAQWRWARKHYSHIEHGGWWCNGIDPLNNWQPMYWGCFKPYQPRNAFDPKGKIKPVKYEHPPKSPTRAFFLQVPDHIWAKVAARYGVPIDPEDLGDGETGRRGDGEREDENLSSAPSPCSPSATPTSSPNQPQFWQWVWDNNIPVIIVEGAKKAGCLLTLGYAAIALPGVTGGVRTKTPQGEKCDPYLIPELQHFATEEREIYICFDRDSKRQTIQNVNREIGKLGRLFTAAHCPVKVINLPGPEKGVDDFVVSKGEDAFSALKNEAQGFQFWLDRESWLLTYPASLKLNSRYLGKLPYPESGLACIKAPKGTGKTQALTNLVSQSLDTGDRRVLIITHRIQLGRAICASLGINYIDETRDSAEGKLFGYGLCIDSLHPLSQAKFNPEDWFGAIVIIDECEQVIWHALNSSTCRENRVAILQTLQELIHNVLTSGGLVVAQDADLSDYSIDYLIAIAGIPISPWVVVNEWRPKRGRDVTFFATSNPASLYVQMEQILSQEVTCCDLESHAECCPISLNCAECECKKPAKCVSENPSECECKKPAKCGCETTAKCSHINFAEDSSVNTTECPPIERYRPRIMVVEDSQKVTGKWSCRNLETQLQKRFPHQRILRIDSESVSDPNHPAYGCIDQLNALIQNYDIIIASPTIGTGVSIDIRGYFTAVFGIFQGAVAVNDALQALARVRDENVPWFVWTKQFGLGKIGNGSASYRAIIKSQQKVIKTNIKLLHGVDFDIDIAHDPVHLRTWALMAARINAGMWNYREAIWEGLKSEGHQVMLCRENQLQREIQVLQNQQLAANNCQNWDLLEQLTEQAQELEEELENLETVANYLSDEAKVIREENKVAEASGVTNAENITLSEYLKLKDKRAKTKAELDKQRKYQLWDTYGVPVTPELKLRDDDGWLPKISLHYYLSYDPEFVKLRDKNHLAGHQERGKGKVCPQDLRLLTARVEALKKLGVMEFLNPDEEFRGTDALVIAFAEKVKLCSVDVKDFLGISVNPKAKPMEVVQYILRGKLGFTLRRVRQERSEERDALGRPKRIRVYQFEFPQDGREAIFEVWQQRDKEAVSAEAATQCLRGVSSGTGSDNNIEISKGVSPLDFPQQNNEVGTVGTGSDNNIGMSEGVFSQDFPQQNNEVGTAGTGSDNNIEISEGVSPLDEEWAHTTQVFGVEAAPGETLTTEGMGVAASYQVIEPENHVIPTYEAKVPQMAPSELKVGSVVRFCGEVQKYVVRAVAGAQVMVKSLFSGQFVNTYAHRLELAEEGTG